MTLEFHLIILLLALGLLNGVLAGLLGIGGGLVIVPAMVWLLPKIGVPAEHLMHMALATSMATICFTAISSAYAHHKRGSVSTRLLKILVPAIAAGALLGAYIADLIDSIWLGRIFGAGAVLMGLQMILGKQPTAKGGQLSAANAAPAGVFMGALSSLLGIGGGSLVVPYLLYHKENLVMAIGTAAACGLPLAIMATIGYVVLGWNVADLPPYHLGYVYLPAVAAIALGSVASAPIGAYLAHKLPTQIIKRIFAVLLIVVGIKIFLNHL
ncbi:MAG: sulfite exporter TauE/SafE family protein [Gammaproteobacteria bacterium]|nr:sulfite exporter TauE/SafE family protein [Gammaproteobacteria bacterium]